MNVRWSAALLILILVTMPAAARQTVRAVKNCEGAGCFIPDRNLRFTLTTGQVIRWKAEGSAWTTNHVVVLVQLAPGAPWPSTVAVSELLTGKSNLATGPRSGQYFLLAGDWLLNINHPRMGRGSYQIDFDLLQPALEIDQRSIDFTGDLDACKARDAVRKLTVTNRSELDLSVQTVTSDSHFRARMTSDLIRARSTASLDVIFRPSGVPTIAGTVTLQARATPRHMLRETDVQAAVAVRGGSAPAGPRMEVSPSIVEFGSVAIGASAVGFFSVKNAGRSDLKLALLPGCPAGSPCGADLEHFTPRLDEQHPTMAPCSVRTFAQRYAPRRSGSHAIAVVLGGENDPAGTLIGLVLRGNAR